MPGPRAVQNLQMPDPRDWQGVQMPLSSPGDLGAGGIDWCIIPDDAVDRRKLGIQFLFLIKAVNKGLTRIVLLLSSVYSFLHRNLTHEK